MDGAIQRKIIQEQIDIWERAAFMHEVTARSAHKIGNKPLEEIARKELVNAEAMVTALRAELDAVK